MSMRMLILGLSAVPFAGGLVYGVASLFYTIPAVMAGKSGREALKAIPFQLRRFGQWCIGAFIVLLALSLFVT